MKIKSVAIIIISLLLVFVGFQAYGSTAFALAKLDVGNLYPGSYGKDVEELQIMLVQAGLFNGSVDGIYGPKTVASVKKIQKYLGVKADGVFGPKTLAAYNSILSEAQFVQTMLETQTDRYEMLYGKVIGIDPGHQKERDNVPEPIGPYTDRTKIRMSEGSKGVKTGSPEYRITLAVAMKLSALLENAGADVVLTRVFDNVYLSNKERAEMMNEAGVDFWLRLHCDASYSSEQNGAKAVIPTKKSNPDIFSKSKALGDAVLDSFCDATGARNNSLVRRSDQTGFNWSDYPVITLEMGYLSNTGDDLKLNRDSYQDECAKGIYNGIIDYFGEGNG